MLTLLFGDINVLCSSEDLFLMVRYFCDLVQVYVSIESRLRKVLINERIATSLKRRRKKSLENKVV